MILGDLLLGLQDYDRDKRPKKFKSWSRSPTRVTISGGAWKKGGKVELSLFSPPSLGIEEMMDVGVGKIYGV